MVALIFGVTGQDGSYLAELLLSKGYVVHGTRRPSSTNNLSNIKDLPIKLHHSDLTDPLNILSIIKEVCPDEIYNLAAISHVKISFDMPQYAFDANAVGILNILQSVKLLGLKSKVYQASTSELYGLVQEVPQSETTPFYPRSPYAIAKQFAYWTVVNYREAYNMFACNGILFNHESPRRGEAFVTRKITKAVVAISKGIQQSLTLGNLDAKRDWGHAKDYVNAMWLMLQQDKPEDFVIATGITTTVRDFVTLAFYEVGISIGWIGIGVNEIGFYKGEPIVFVDSKYYRPAEVELLIGDPLKAKTQLGWQCEYNLQSLIKEMVQHEFR